ncbi:hypothetical protein DFH06DRAFT_1383791 [Mycena polygramma]|nr:hypothetical protein DFH06DRAFT_1383791 [Mycena polygramma]
MSPTVVSAPSSRALSPCPTLPETLRLCLYIDSTQLDAEIKERIYARAPQDPRLVVSDTPRNAKTVLERVQALKAYLYPLGLPLNTSSLGCRSIYLTSYCDHEPMPLTWTPSQGFSVSTRLRHSLAPLKTEPMVGLLKPCPTRTFIHRYPKAFDIELVARRHLSYFFGSRIQRWDESPSISGTTPDDTYAQHITFSHAVLKTALRKDPIDLLNLSVLHSLKNYSHQGGRSWAMEDPELECEPEGWPVRARDGMGVRSRRCGGSGQAEWVMEVEVVQRVCEERERDASGSTLPQDFCAEFPGGSADWRARRALEIVEEDAGAGADAARSGGGRGGLRVRLSYTHASRGWGRNCGEQREESEGRGHAAAHGNATRGL